jgi:hypothetical protein
MSEGPFGEKWLREHLVLRKYNAKGPDRKGSKRIIRALNRAYAAEMRKNELPSTPSWGPAAPFQALGFRISVDGSGIVGYRQARPTAGRTVMKPFGSNIAGTLMCRWQR